MGRKCNFWLDLQGNAAFGLILFILTFTVYTDRLSAEEGGQNAFGARGLIGHEGVVVVGGVRQCLVMME